MSFSAFTAASRANWAALARKHYVWLVILIAVPIYLARLPTFQVGSYMDDGHYIALAKSISSGQGYRSIQLVGAQLATFYPFGYPLLLAPLVYLFPHTFLPLQLLSTLLALGAIYLFWAFLSQRVSALIALLVLLLFAFQPGVVAHASMVMTEMAYIFFSILALVLLDRYARELNALTWNGGGLALAAAMAYFVRVPGVILIGSILVYLLLRRQFRKAAAFGLIVALAVGLWSYRNWTVADALISKDYEEYHLTSSVGDYLIRLPAKTEDYVSILPNSLVPFLGPKMTHLLSVMHPWLPPFFNLVVLGITLAGYFHSVRKKLGAADIHVVGLMGLLLVFGDYGEARYLLPIVPFLYLYLMLGTSTISHWVLSRIRISIRLTHVVVLCAVGILLLNVARDVQGIVHPARQRIPDISLGATWIRDHSSPDAVVMARIPPSTFLYAERAMVPYPDGAFEAHYFYGELPELAPRDALMWTIETFGADYLLIAPPIRASTGPFVPQLDDYTRSVVLPIVDSHSARFRLVYDNPSQQVFVYEVQK